MLSVEAENKTSKKDWKLVRISGESYLKVKLASVKTYYSIGDSLDRILAALSVEDMEKLIG